MALPPPSSSSSGGAFSAKRMFGFSGSGSGAFKPRATNTTYNTRYRTLPLNQILAQREGGVAARYQDGTAVPDGMRINVPGFNTSGVGPGTRGYTGSWRPGGYNFGMGTGRPSARTSGEFYAQRDEFEGNPLDNLELGNSNLMGSFLRNAMAEARGTSGVAGATTASANPWADRTTFGDGSGSLPAPGAAEEPDAAQIQQLIAEARRQETMDMLEARRNQSPSISGTGLTTPGATIEGMPADLYFQYKANDTGEANRFATDPYAGGDTEEAWQYSTRLAPFLRRLGIGQPFPSRRPL
jgi:hypothetical protein